MGVKGAEWLFLFRGIGLGESSLMWGCLGEILVGVGEWIFVRGSSYYGIFFKNNNMLNCRGKSLKFLKGEFYVYSIFIVYWNIVRNF